MFQQKFTKNIYYNNPTDRWETKSLGMERGGEEVTWQEQASVRAQLGL